MLSIFLPFFTFYAVRPSTMCFRDRGECLGQPHPTRRQGMERPEANTPWPLPHRATPVPRFSHVESGARCRMATREMHLAMEGDQLFINDLAKQLVVELRAAC